MRFRSTWVFVFTYGSPFAEKAIPPPMNVFCTVVKKSVGHILYRSEYMFKGEEKPRPSLNMFATIHLKIKSGLNTIHTYNSGRLYKNSFHCGEKLNS